MGNLFKVLISIDFCNIFYPAFDFEVKIYLLFSEGCILPQNSIYELEWDVYLNYFRIITAMNRNDHYVTQLSLEVGLSVLNEIKEISSFFSMKILTESGS